MGWLESGISGIFIFIDIITQREDTDLTFKKKGAVVSILLYGCTSWTLTKRLEKKLHGNYTRML